MLAETVASINRCGPYVHVRQKTLVCRSDQHTNSDVFSPFLLCCWCRNESVSTCEN